MLFANLLNYTLRDTSVRLIDSEGRSRIVGQGDNPVCAIRINNRHLDYKLIRNPGLFVPEAYMDGDLIIEDGTLYDFIEACARNYHHLEAHPLFRVARWFDLAKLGQFNPMARARKNVAHHYDLSEDLYALFLDEDRQYSCAYFTETETDLESAQLAKKRHIASKLLLKPGNKILDIGCGWGGLGLYLAQVENVDVTGITLSTEQFSVAQRRAEKAALSDRIGFRLQDYRKEKSTYDRIVSVGMFEHVGKRNYREFFETIRNLLHDDGVMVLHSIGRLDQPAPINPFIRKYIFPGTDLPSLSEVMTVVEPLGLVVTDIEILRLHYAETLRQWRERFMKNRDEAVKIYDERFCRMWELYFVICELGFRHQNLMVFQLQLAKNLDAVPLTRDYMIDWERRRAVEEGAKRQYAA
ncbi:MAG: class I SAM-dependent methyltransferase [Rhodospirillaceae bacterium]|jgi:cyclopropane-fatty-acyl-phospholipid synthase|nr:class I SAM-dependent methyltransferase [Rhodospirillaceae bacterium]